MIIRATCFWIVAAKVHNILWMNDTARRKKGIEKGNSALIDYGARNCSTFFIGRENLAVFQYSTECDLFSLSLIGHILLLILDKNFIFGEKEPAE